MDPEVKKMLTNAQPEIMHFFFINLYWAETS